MVKEYSAGTGGSLLQTLKSDCAVEREFCNSASVKDTSRNCHRELSHLETKLYHSNEKFNVFFFVRAGRFSKESLANEDMVLDGKVLQKTEAEWLGTDAIPMRQEDMQ